MKTNETNDEGLRDRLLVAAERCVLCGMCSRVCPTYALYKEEGESPRGRVVAMQRFLQGGETTERWQVHLSHCLGCRACEAVCPSGVPYGELLDGVRALAGPSRPGLVDGLARGIVFWRCFGGVLRGLQRMGVARVPALPVQGRWARCYPAAGEGRGEVVLFLGCVASLWDRDTLVAAVRLLNLAGYTVHVPPHQGCCGALAWHEGRREEGRAAARRLIEAFPEGMSVVVAATGCSSHLREYGALLGERGADFAARVEEVGAWLDREDLPVRWCTEPVRVALHVPCSQTHGLRRPELYRSLLAGLPGVEVVDWCSELGCCGAAGARVLREPVQARALRAPLVARLQELGVDVALTTNVGCRLHLAGGMAEAAVDIPLIHPLAFLVERIKEVVR